MTYDEIVNQKYKKSITFFCEVCDYTTNLKCSFDKHSMTPKHIKSTKSISKSIQNKSKYYCKACDYKTDIKCNFVKHTMTPKHIKSTESIEKSINNQNVCNNCNKAYKDKSGLWRHNQKCLPISQPEEEPTFQLNEESILVKEEDEPSEKQLILMLIKENTEFKKIILEQQNVANEKHQNMMELLKNGTHNTTNNTNSHNKTFNLQFFLNETCKDAMNIMDFVESIQLQISDLEKVGEIGYVDGISQIMVQNLKAMDITQRPLHCTDKKREVLYLKDEDKWEKQSEDSAKLRKVIHKVSDKNIRMISAYKEKHPDCNQSDSRYSDQYAHILIEAMGGPGDNRLEKESKIIKNISKEVVVEKAL